MKYTEKEYNIMCQSKKKEILDTLNKLSFNTTNASFKDNLDSIRNNFSSFGIIGSNECYMNLKQMQENLESIQKYIITNNLEYAIYYLNDTEDIVTELKIKNNNVSVAKSKKELKDEEVARKLIEKHEKEIEKFAKKGDKNALLIQTNTKELELLQEKSDQVLSRLKRLQPRINKGNAIADSEFKVLKNNLDTIKKEIVNLETEISRSSAALNIKEFTKHSESLIERRTISEGELSKLIGDLGRINEINEQARSQADLATKALSDLSVSSSEPIDDLFLNNDNKKIDDSFLDAFTSKTEVVNKNNLFNNNSLFNENSKIVSAIDTIESKLKEIDKEIHKNNQSLIKLNEEVKDLIEEREFLSASECLAHDAKINVIISKRNTLKNNIKRFRNLSDQLAVKADILNRARNQEDIFAINEEIKNVTNGESINLDELVANLSLSISENNEEIKKGEELMSILENTNDVIFSEIEKPETFTKDANKYDDVLKDINVSQQN